MNCKPNCIARIVRVEGLPNNDNIGKLVRCIEISPELSALAMAPAWLTEALQPMELMDPEFRLPALAPAGSICYFLDEELRPLHDGDGTDEMLRITGKPADDPALTLDLVEVAS